MRILGPDGKPVQLPARELAERRTRPQPFGLRRPGQWSPTLATLTTERLRAILQTVAAGTWCPEYLELAEEIEERDGHYRGILTQRVLAAAGAPLDVMPAGEDDAHVELADEVRRRVLDAPAMHQLRLDLLDAVAKGYAAVEVVWAWRERRWTPASYHRIDPRWIVVAPDGETPLVVDRDGAWGAHAGVDQAWGGWSLPGRPLMAGKELWHCHRTKAGHPARGGLAFVMATLWLLKSAAVRGWAALAEVFGMPLRIGRYGRDAKPEEIDTLIDAINALALDAGCAIPDSVNIEIQQQLGGGGGKSAGGAAGPYQGIAAWVNSEASKAVLGQTMTADDGSSRAQAEVHADVREDLIADDARQLGDTISTLVRWYCELNGLGPPPRVALPPPPDEIDVAAIQGLARAGLRVPSAWVRERVGIPEPRTDEEIMTGLPPGASPRRRRGGPGAPAPDDDEPGEDGPASAAALAAEDLADAVRRVSDSLVRAARSRLRGGPGGVLAAEAPALAALREDLALRAFGARVEGAGDEEGDALAAERRPGRIPAAALRVLRSKRRTPSAHWTDVWREEHGLAFTAAWLTSDDLVAEMHRALQRALADGETMESFRRRLLPRMREMGWAPPLRGGTVATRLRRIYDTNMRTARSAGRWQAALAADRRSPGEWLLAYELGPSIDHREDHAAWAGAPTILPVSSPWWATHWPPNGWGCKCRTRLVTAAEAERLGGPSPEPAPPRAERVGVRAFDARTGEVSTRMVTRTPGIDPGWDYNPGQLRPAGVSRAVTGHVEQLLTGRTPAGEANAWAALSAADRSGMARRRIGRHLRGDAFRAFVAPVGGLPRLDAIPARWQADAPLAVLPAGYLGGAGAEVLRLPLSLVAEAAAPSPGDYGRLQRMVDAAAAVDEGGGRWRLEGGGWTAIVERDADGRPVLAELMEGA